MYLLFAQAVNLFLSYHCIWYHKWQTVCRLTCLLFLLDFYLDSTYCLIDQANRYWHVCHAWLNTGTMMIKGQYVVNVSIYRCTFILFLGSLAYKAQIYVV